MKAQIGIFNSSLTNIDLTLNLSPNFGKQKSNVMGVEQAAVWLVRDQWIFCIFHQQKTCQNKTIDVVQPMIDGPMDLGSRRSDRPMVRLRAPSHLVQWVIMGMFQSRLTPEAGV
jgi:hypothetical protein